jgi:hypothetical protein
VREIVPPSVASLKEILQKNAEKNLKNALSQELGMFVCLFVYFGLTFAEGFEPAVIEHCIISAGMSIKDKASSIGLFQFIYSCRNPAYC